MLLADEPGLAAACSSALICDEPSVRVSRQRIHGELQRRVRTALRSGAWPEVAETLEFGLIGALVHASCGADTFRQTAEESGWRGGRRVARVLAHPLRRHSRIGREMRVKAAKCVDLDAG